MKEQDKKYYYIENINKDGFYFLQKLDVYGETRFKLVDNIKPKKVNGRSVSFLPLDESFKFTEEELKGIPWQWRLILKEQEIETEKEVGQW